MSFHLTPTPWQNVYPTSRHKLIITEGLKKINYFKLSNDFKEILTNMFSKYDEMNNMLNKYKEKFPKQIKDIEDIKVILGSLNDAINEIKEKPIPYINIKSINEVNITKPTEIKNSQQP